MRLGYSLFIALRYLGSRRRKGLSFNTLVSIGGVALGVCTLLVVLAVMSGFHQDLQEKILGVNAHVVVLGAQGPLQNYQALAQALRQRPQVLSASPFVLGQVMLARGGAAQGVYLRGVLPSEAQAEMGRFMKEGSLSALAQRHEGLAGIVLGRELALRLGAFQGDVLRLLSPRMELGPLGMLPKVREFRVAGVFEVGMFEYDSNLALVSLQAAQEFFGLGDRVTGLQLRLRDIYQAPQLARTLQEQLGYTVVVRDWVQMNRSLFAALKLEKLAMFVILVLIILVAAFNIVSTLMMTVLQKERDIAILRAMGASRRGIMGGLHAPGPAHRPGGHGHRACRGAGPELSPGCLPADKAPP
jgi:lipoprotein-releasing system permease protein